MSNVTRLRHALPLSQDINTAVSALDKAIADAVDAAVGKNQHEEIEQLGRSVHAANVIR